MHERVSLELGREIKYQHIRVLDVVLIGPLMMWAGAKLSEQHPTAGPLLAAFGVATVYTNGKNYLRIRDRLADSGPG